MRCINQSENREKVQQIHLMANIFNSAVRVAAYLGEESDDSGLALLTLIQIQVKATAPRNWPSNLPPIPPSWGDEYIPPADDPVWKAITALFARPWFRRAWIIQEAVVAAKVTVICGDWAIDWNELVGAVENCDSEIKTSGEQFQFLDNIFSHFRILVKRREDMAKKEAWALLGLLEFFRYAEATRQRDRLFALLNLAADKEGNLGFRPDYDCPFETVVLRYGRAFVEQGRTLAMLYHAGLSSKKDPRRGEDPNRFPSWIPDWTILRRESLFESLKRGVPHAPPVGLELRARFEAGVENELVLGTLITDEIVSVSSEANIPSRTREYLQQISETINKHGSQCPTREDRSELKWRVPIADAKFPQITHSGYGRLKYSYSALMELFDSSLTSGVIRDSDQAVLQSHNAKCQDYLNALHGGFHGWRFVVTKKGYFGIASRLVRVGDAVSIFGGSQIVFLLRRGENDAPWHRLVGDCYIHGIDSSYFDGIEEQEVRLH